MTSMGQMHKGMGDLVKGMGKTLTCEGCYVNYVPPGAEEQVGANPRSFKD